MRRRKKILLGVGGVIALIALYLLFWPVGVDPIAWEPPEAPALEGDYALNSELARAERLDIGGAGPEDVAIDAEGRIYGGLKDGRIVRMAADGSGLEDFAQTGGRPLGLHFDAAGNLLVADAFEGLLSIAPDGAISVLSTEAGGRPFKFTDDVDIAPDGTIYFSDASWKWDQHHYREDTMESRPHGRLLAYDPATKATRVVLDELYFANGVAVSEDGAFVLVNETTRYRVKKHWLKGPKAGQTEVIIDNLPGFPDGISRGTDGRFWVALFTPRVAAFDSILPSPFLRKVVYRLPRFLQPDPVPHGFVLGIDANGRVVHNLQDPAETSFSPVTSVEEHGGMLYLGSLHFPAVGRLPAPAR